MIRIIFFVTLFYSFSGIGISQFDCNGLVILEEVFLELHALGTEVPKGKVYYLNYTINSQPKSPDSKGITDNISVWLASNKSVMLSDHIEVYSNDQYTFTVLPKQKKVISSPSSKNSGAKIQQQYITKMQDSLLFYATTIRCNLIGNSDKPFYKINLELNVRGKELFQINSMQYYVDSSSKRITKSRAHFTSKSNWRSIEMKFHDLDFDYKGSKILIDFEREFLNDDRLIGKYQDFEFQTRKF